MKAIVETFKKYPLLWSLLLLAMQNITVFFWHYSGDVTFTKDFTVSYYPMTAFWIGLFKQGIFAEWVPYQTMGMPMVLTMQSGLFYPFYWVFALAGALPFTLHAATVFQCLHVLAGAIGALLFARVFGLSLVGALFCAVCFQFFGGTYVISSSPDIIRSYAWLPWIFWASHITLYQEKLAARNLLLPFIILFLMTGGYPGTNSAQILMVGFLCFFTGIKYILTQYHAWKKITSLYLFVLLLALAGILFSAVYLLPVMASKDFLMRGESWSGNIMNWRFTYWNTLFSASYAEGIYKDPSTKSAFIGLPVFCLLFLMTFKELKTFWPLCLVCALAFLMAKGHESFLYDWLVNTFEFLGYSRFVASDYRGVFALILIFMAARILESGAVFTGKNFSKRVMLCLVPLLICWGIFESVHFFSTLPKDSNHQLVADYPSLAKLIYSMLAMGPRLFEQVKVDQWWLAVSFSMVIFMGFYLLQKKKHFLLVAFFFFAFISGGFYLKHMQVYWVSDMPVDAHYNGLPLNEPLPVVVHAKESIVGRKPCKEMNVWENTWKGFLLGESLCNAHVAVTNPRKVVRENKILEGFMTLPGRLVDLEDPTQCDSALLQAASSSTHISSLSYRLQDIHYQVNSEQAFCFVENELYFSGWQGHQTDSRSLIVPQPYCGALRAWCLPAGQYEFVSTYHTPALLAGWWISCSSMLFYILALVWFYLRDKRKKLAISA